MFIVGAIIIVSIVIGLVMKVITKFSKKEKKLTTFDAMDGAMMRDDLKSSRNTDEYQDNLNDSIRSDLTDFKYGLENP